jgi:hypothetical protein
MTVVKQKLFEQAKFLLSQLTRTQRAKLWREFEDEEDVLDAEEALNDPERIPYKRIRRETHPSNGCSLSKSGR